MITLVDCRPNVSWVHHTMMFEAPLEKHSAESRRAIFKDSQSYHSRQLSCVILSREILGRDMFIRDSNYRDTLEFIIVTHKIFFSSFSLTRCRSWLSDAATPYNRLMHNLIVLSLRYLIAMQMKSVSYEILV